MTTTAPDLNTVRDILRRHLPSPAYRAVRFGSRARGGERPMSDWDIGILGPAPLAGAALQRIREDLENLPTLHNFDVVDLTGVSDRLSRQCVGRLRTAHVMPADRSRVRLDTLDRALRRLRAALARPKDEWTRDAAIQRFEFTFELTWKSLAHAVRNEGLECASPRQAFRAAASLGWIADDTRWLDMLEDRNRTTHT